MILKAEFNALVTWGLDKITHPNDAIPQSAITKGKTNEGRDARIIALPDDNQYQADKYKTYLEKRNIAYAEETRFQNDGKEMNCLVVGGKTRKAIEQLETSVQRHETRRNPSHKHNGVTPLGATGAGLMALGLFGLMNK